MTPLLGALQAAPAEPLGETAIEAVIADEAVVQEAADEAVVVVRDAEVTVAAAEDPAAVTAVRGTRASSNRAHKNEKVRDENRGLFCAQCDERSYWEVFPAP